MSDNLKNLFSPIKIKSMELKNRAVMPAIGTAYGNMDSTISDRLVKYLARRAQGGTGLIITEVCAVDPRGKGFPNEIGAWSDHFISGLSTISDAVHREGGKAAVQLHHAGRETSRLATGAMPEAPSPIPSVILNQPCEEMSIDRIKEIIDAYAKAAVRVQKAGFDAVEIHGAHGYLLTQFLSPFSNRRNDIYGGSEENRSRFVIEILKAVRSEVGSDFPILIRVSSDELVRGGYDLDFMIRLAPRLVSAGADVIHASVGVYSTPGNLSIASMDSEPGFNLFRAQAIKQVVNVPIIGVGRINDPVFANKAIGDGYADLISFGRQHLTDPDFLKKAQIGNYDDIRWCVACNQGCIERLTLELKSTTCTFNPECGQEYKRIEKKSEKKKNIWIIGSGPAGLSAALSAVEFGSNVTIFEKDSEPGGQLISASKPPHKSVLLDWALWSINQLKKSGVKIEYNKKLTEDYLISHKPDGVILATGAMPSTPNIPGINSDNVFDARDVLTGKVEVKGSAVILGAGYVGMETADYLISSGIDVTIIEMSKIPPVDKQTAHGYWLNKRIQEASGKIILGAMVTRIENDAVIYKHQDEEKRITAPIVITAMGAKSIVELEVPLKKNSIPYIIVGDAKSPRRLFEAIHEGYRAGKDI